MKVTTLIENTVFRKNLTAEHGLSLLIENNGKKVLFDTGQGSNFISNARSLGVDLTEVDAVAVSHGHYDHAGGLGAFCDLNRSAPIHVKAGFFTPKYHDQNRFIGVEYRETLFKGRIKTVENVVEVIPGAFLVPDIPVANEWDTHNRGLTVKSNGEFRTDHFEDEQFLVVPKDGRLNIISGCSHRGITNIIRSAEELFHLPIGLVLGGFHTSDCDGPTMDQFITELSSRKIGMIGVCHCTGIDKYARIRESFGNDSFYNSTGNSFEL